MSVVKSGSVREQKLLQQEIDMPVCIARLHVGILLKAEISNVVPASPAALSRNGF